jgi:hypothetical protein
LRLLEVADGLGHALLAEARVGGRARSTLPDGGASSRSVGMPVRAQHDSCADLSRIPFRTESSAFELAAR